MATDGLEHGPRTAAAGILLDIVMPGADGWQVLHDLKADPEQRNIPVILLTIVDKKALGFRLGAAAYLLKPLDPAEVRGTLDRSSRERQVPQKRVLVVDDDPNVADMLRQFLPESDFTWIRRRMAMQACRRSRRIGPISFCWISSCRAWMALA